MSQKVCRQFVPGKDISEIAQICRIKQSRVLRILVEKNISSYTYLNALGEKRIDDWAKIPMSAIKYHAFHQIEDPTIKNDPNNFVLDKYSSLCLEEETQLFSGGKVRIKYPSDRYILGYQRVFLSSEDTEHLLAEMRPSRQSDDSGYSFVALLVLAERFNLSELQLMKLCAFEKVALYFLGREFGNGRAGYHALSGKILKKAIASGSELVQLDGSGTYPIGLLFLKSESVGVLRSGRSSTGKETNVTPPNRYAPIHNAYVNIAVEILKSAKKKQFLTPKGFNRSLLAAHIFSNKKDYEELDQHHLEEKSIRVLLGRRSSQICLAANLCPSGTKKVAPNPSIHFSS